MTGKFRASLPIYTMLGATALSQVGNMLTFVPVPWFVLKTTRYGRLPPAAPVNADRLPRRLRAAAARVDGAAPAPGRGGRACRVRARQRADQPGYFTFVQERASAAMLGRVLGALIGLAMAAAPLGMLVAGFALEAAGIGGVLIGIVILYLLTTVFLMLSPALREMDRRTPDTEGVATTH